MRITIEWAMTRGDSAYKACEWCEAEFEPQPVIVCVDPPGYQIASPALLVRYKMMEASCN